MDVAARVAGVAKQLIKTLTDEIGDPDGWPHVAGTGEIFWGNGILAWRAGIASELPRIPNMPEHWKYDHGSPRFDELFENVRLKRDFFSKQLSKSELIEFVASTDPASGLIQLGELAELVDGHLSDFHENYLISRQFVTSGALATRLTQRQARHSRVLTLARWLALLTSVQQKPLPPTVPRLEVVEHSIRIDGDWLPLMGGPKTKERLYDFLATLVTSQEFATLKDFDLKTRDIERQDERIQNLFDPNVPHTSGKRIKPEWFK